MVSEAISNCKLDSGDSCVRQGLEEAVCETPGTSHRLRK